MCEFLYYRLCLTDLNVIVHKQKKHVVVCKDWETSQAKPAIQHTNWPWRVNPWMATSQLDREYIVNW